MSTLQSQTYVPRIGLPTQCVFLIAAAIASLGLSACVQQPVRSGHHPLPNRSAQSKKSTQSEPKRDDVLLDWSRGSEAYRAHNLNLAKRNFNALIAQDPRHAAALFRLGNIAYWQGNSAMAMRRYRQALKFAPRYAAGHYNLAMVDLAEANMHLRAYMHAEKAAGYPNNNQKSLLMLERVLQQFSSDVRKTKNTPPDAATRAP